MCACKSANGCYDKATGTSLFRFLFENNMAWKYQRRKCENNKNGASSQKTKLRKLRKPRNCENSENRENAKIAKTAKLRKTANTKTTKTAKHAKTTKTARALNLGSHLDSKNKAGGRLSHLALKKGFGLENGFGPVKRENTKSTPRT